MAMKLKQELQAKSRLECDLAAAERKNLCMTMKLKQELQAKSRLECDLAAAERKNLCMTMKLKQELQAKSRLECDLAAASVHIRALLGKFQSHLPDLVIITAIFPTCSGNK